MKTFFEDDIQKGKLKEFLFKNLFLGFLGISNKDVSNDTINKKLCKGKSIYKYQYNITTDWSMPHKAKLYKTKWFYSQEECFINALEIAKSKFSL